MIGRIIAVSTIVALLFGQNSRLFTLESIWQTN